MENSANLNLPYIMPSQAQKHVTHNEAIRKLDALVHLSALSADFISPPSDSQDGERYIVGANATGPWQGRDNQVAAFQDGNWMYFAPQKGWVCWLGDTEKFTVWNGLEWNTSSNSDELNQLQQVGIATDADAVNRLSIRSQASLFSNEGSGHQLKVNRATVDDTASLLFQTGFAGNAEMGVVGDNKFRIKTSEDGNTFHGAMVADADGSVLMPNTQHICGVYHASRKTPFETSSDTYVPVPELSVTVNPKSANSRFLIAASIAGYKKDSFSGYVRLVRNGTEILSGDHSGVTNGSGLFVDLATTTQWGIPSKTNFGVDEPATDLPLTYSIEIRTGNAQEPIYINKNHRGDSNSNWLATPSSNLIILEIAK